MSLGWSIALVVLVAAVAVVGGWPVTAGVLRLAARSGDSTAAGHPGGAPVTDEPTAGPVTSTLRGGTWIGLLERLGVFGAVLSGYAAAIAFVIAVKGLGRYPEIREHPEVSERFVIGTLASLLWAAGAGLAARAVLGL